MDQVCRTCNKLKSYSDFYENRTKPNQPYFLHCKECYLAKVAKEHLKFKIDCVNYKGGCCMRCGYNKCLWALEFHHINRDIKNFEITKHYRQSLTNVVINELNLCHLLCGNCHREVEYETEYM